MEPFGACTELCVVALGAGGEWGRVPVAKRSEGTLKRGTVPHSWLSPIPLHTADRHSLFLQAYD